MGLPDQSALIRHIVEDHMSKVEIGRLYGVTYAAVSQALPPEYRQPRRDVSEVVSFPVRPEHRNEHPFKMLKRRLSIQEGYSYSDRAVAELERFEDQLSRYVWIYDENGVRRVARRPEDGDEVFRSAK